MKAKGLAARPISFRPHSARLRLKKAFASWQNLVSFRGREEIRMSAIDPRINLVCDGYKRAVRQKDVEAFLNLYHPDARVFDTWGGWAYDGVKERRKAIEGWFSSLGEESVAVTIDRVQVTVSHDLATLTGRAVYVALSAAGVELRGMQNRLTWVLKLEAGIWKIIHEHTSVAIGPDLKGMLERD
jgi:uncharacterized protein (TIGR02246 family)